MSIVNIKELNKRSVIFRKFILEKLRVLNILSEKGDVDIDTFRNLCYRYFDKRGDIAVIHYKKRLNNIIRAIWNPFYSRRALGNKLFKIIIEDILGLVIDDDNINQLVLIGRSNDLRGQRFHKLTVVSCLGRNDDKTHTLWKYVCDCGETGIATTGSLNSGATSSCGCYNREIVSNMFTTHGLSLSDTYKSWEAMKRRCYSHKDVAYPRYGGRGIIVCDRWLNSFENFYEDMGERPEGTTLDRIGNEGNYEPDNCKWSSRKEQANNQNRTLRFDDGESVGEFASRLNIPYWYVKSKFDKGCSKELIIKLRQRNNV
jgi:hypothetical protein